MNDMTMTMPDSEIETTPASAGSETGPVPLHCCDAPTVLQWVLEAGTWTAENTAGVPIPSGEEGAGEPSMFFIDQAAMAGDGATIQYVVDGGKNLIGEPAPDHFLDLVSAQAWCAQRNHELWTAASKEADAANSAQVAAESDPGELEEKVGSRTDVPLNECSIAPDVWQQIREARDNEREAESRVEDLSSELKEAKKDLDAASKKLGQLIDDAERCATEPYLPGIESKPAPIAPPAEVTAAVMESPVAREALASARLDGETQSVPADDEAWRALTLEQIGITGARTLKALHNHTPEILTFGQLAEWQAKKGQYWATDVKGLGPVSKQEIEDATDKYWIDHPGTAKVKIEPLQETANDIQVGADGSVRQAVVDCLAGIEQVTPVLAIGEDADSGGWNVIIETARRSDGTFGYRFFVRLGGETSSEISGIDSLSRPFVGNLATQAAAATAAADAIHDWIKALPPNATRGERANWKHEIVRQLDGLDKFMKGQPGSADQQNAEAVSEAVTEGSAA